MAVQLAAPVVIRQPTFDKGGAAVGIAGLVVTMGAGMRGKGIACVEAERPLDLTRAGRDIAQLDARPAEISEEPPILVPTRREAFQQCELHLVKIGAAAEAQKAE